MLTLTIAMTAQLMRRNKIFEIQNILKLKRIVGVCFNIIVRIEVVYT